MITAATLLAICGPQVPAIYPIEFWQTDHDGNHVARVDRLVRDERRFAHQYWRAYVGDMYVGDVALPLQVKDFAAYGYIAEDDGRTLRYVPGSAASKASVVPIPHA